MLANGSMRVHFRSTLLLGGQYNYGSVLAVRVSGVHVIPCVREELRCRFCLQDVFYKAGGLTASESDKHCSLCRESFSASFRRMYGLPANWTNLPPMPADGGSWSALHSWAMPTSSFVELVMFSRYVFACDSALHSRMIT